jgi:serine acetyltransferase
MSFRLLVSFAALFLPWLLRRLVLVHLLGYTIDKTAQIGFSWICPHRLEMGPYSRIGHLNLCKEGLELLRLGEKAIIGNVNWITGEPLTSRVHFKHRMDRCPQLVLANHASITNRHYIDCTAPVYLGRFSVFAGCRSQIMTHSVDLYESRQDCFPVRIGDFCFVGTDCVLLGGASLPDYSVLGAKSLLNKSYCETYYLYAGVPARPVKKLPSGAKYFTRAMGFVN